MGTYKTYALGFAISVLLTLTAYFLVVNNLLSSNLLVLAIMTLAIIQLWVQLIMFLHLGQEVGPKWKLAAWISALAIILVVVIGSLWIMNNLRYHMPTDDEIIKNEGYK